MNVTTNFHMEGSALRGTLEGRPLAFDTHVEVDSSEPREKITRLLRIAENSCYVVQSLLAPVSLNRSFAINGEDVAEQEVFAEKAES